MTTLSDVRAVVEDLWPADRAEGWDAVGLVAGDPSQRIERILLAVDPVLETAAEARELNADMLLVHHPLLLRGVTSVAADRPKGRIVTDLIGSGIALLAAHTNADIVERGTSAELALAIGLTETRPIVANGADESIGLGRIGTLPEPTTLGALAAKLAQSLPSTATGVRGAGDYTETVQRIAVCGGAGDSLLEHEAVLEADAYVTADLRHHPASEARDRHSMGAGPALIDLSHWASEWLWLNAAREQLAEGLPGVEITVSDLRTDPWDFALPQ
ncbi:Nif3-like dinuclear metal center hexameric protein [Agrococcus casei]|uniref:Nif3-like dinuclear metal center hexameric protein n=1 Tax=Agrococcus casei TaxID=343512 RepID=UPI003F91B296